MYAAFDPGGRTGIATFHSDGKDIVKTSLAEDNFLMYLNTLIEVKDKPFKVFVVEDFRLRENKALDLVGNDFIASQMIGAIKLTAHALKVPIIFQSPSILPTAIKWAGIKPHRGHLPDELSAYAHGIHYLVKNGIRKHRILEEN
jgi:hypothetical protein